MIKYNEFLGFYYNVNQQIIKKFNNSLLNEGLIRSQEYNFAINKIENLLNSYKIGKCYFNHDRITIKIYDDNKKFYKDFISLLNNIGYYVSGYIKNGEYENDNLSSLKEISLIDVNKKYDFEKGIPEILYHVTENIYIEKIKKQGLKLKTLNVIENHPERIYLFKNIEMCLTYIDIRSDILNKPKTDFIILKIDCKLLKHIKIYEDPKFNGEGFYTLDDVPPNAITRFE